ncbi:unnamed protein product [Chrysodeixis includens]|uniref:Mothers against decapentaplegic homolog n=1 Tax=Chrysodeixis includens TaxID=689277 RepID=A0A9N8KWW6_CHRIL|nr:unnamed protein product [Chrysodeixis includens]
MFRRRALRRRLAAAGAPSLPDEQLRRLARALDAGAAGGECVPAGHAASQLRLAVTRAFRFPDLRDSSELRRLPLCADQDCCNPYHWSRLCKPETPPPPYSRYAMEDLKPKEHGESTEDARRTNHERLVTGSLATDGEAKWCPNPMSDGEVTLTIDCGRHAGATPHHAAINGMGALLLSGHDGTSLERQSWESEWCRLAYWELTQRVGRQFGVRVRAVDVFGGGGGACGSGRHGLCLDALDQRGDAPQAEQVKKTRAKIGLGVTLSLESDGVWLYNRSQEPVFVSSPALDAAAAKALLVWRVAPGHCLCIFDPSCPPPAVSLPHIGPVDPRSVRISFAKGWGPKYSRRDVTACPCWLEVLLAPPS